MGEEEFVYKGGRGSSVLVPGLCLFCNNYYNRGKVIKNSAKISERSKVNLSKHRRCFNFLAARFGVPQPKKGRFDTSEKDPEFSFISDMAPLCPSCIILLDQVNALFLRFQSVKFQLGGVVKQIEELVIKSRPKTPFIYTDQDAENESHFNCFRRQVTPLDQQTVRIKETDLEIVLPLVNIVRLQQEEIEKYKRVRETEEETDEENLDDLAEEMMQQFNSDDEIDIKPDFENIKILKKKIRKRDSLSPDEDEADDELFPTLVSVASILQETRDEDLQGIQLIKDSTPIQVFLDIDIPESSQELQLETEEPQEINELENPEESAPPPPPSSSKRKRNMYPKAPDENNCKHCPKIFQTQTQLRTHYLSTHPGLYPRKCPESLCTYECHLTSWMRKHFILKHAPQAVRESTKNQICPTCGKRFHGNNNLRYHMLSHTGEKPFKCTQCGKGFRQQQALDVHHFRIHENVRNFACPHCPWKFKDGPSLKGHIAIHTGEKNNVCHICGVRTIHLHALKSHWKVHVKRGDWVEPPNFNVKKKWVKKKKIVLPQKQTENE